MNFLKGYLVIILVKCISADLNMTEYYKMPKQYVLDDYGRCFDETNKEALYCYVDVIIKPNKSSELWSYIERISADSKHFFRHDRLKRGICINDCKKRLYNFSKSMKMEYYQSHFQNTEEVFTFENALKHRIKYNKLINQCINLELKKEYSLMGYSKIEYCISNRDTIERGTLDYVFAIIVIILLTLITISTYYDYHLKNQKPIHLRTADHYKGHLNEGTFINTMVSFSLVRNWYRLNAKGSSHNASKNLEAFQGIRCITMYGVIIGHIAFVYNIVPIDNPEYFEKKFLTTLMIILTNGPIIIQTYFTMSGFLLAVQFFEFLDKKPEFDMSYFWKGILYRYFRLMPVYGFLMLLSASWMNRFQDGPIWRNVMEAEQTFCRNNWWTNILFINNYVYPNQPCMQHGWYLAAEFQLFILALGLLMLIWRYPKSIKKIIGTAYIITFLIPVIITYYNKFEGIFLVTPESQRYMHLLDKMYLRIYVPTHTNFGGYLTGIVSGIFYFKSLKNINLIKSKLYRCLWYSAAPTLIVMLLSGHIFYRYDFPKPSLWISIYSGLTKPIWGAGFGIISIGFASGLGWKIKDIFRHDMFRSLGRITFCVYLTHTFVIRGTLGYIRQPVYLTDSTLLMSVSSTYFLSYIIGFIVCICIELPFSAIQKIIFDESKPIAETKTETSIEMKRTE